MSFPTTVRYPRQAMYAPNTSNGEVARTMSNGLEIVEASVCDDGDYEPDYEFEQAIEREASLRAYGMGWY